MANIEAISPVLLLDHSWLVPRVCSLCREHSHKALSLYRAAVKAGLKIGDIAGDSCRQLFVGLLTAAIRVNHIDDAKQLLRDLRIHGPGINLALFNSMVKLCTSKHLFADCLEIYEYVLEDPNFAVTDKSIWSCLLFSAMEVRAFHRCKNFFERLKECGVPSTKDYGNMIRLASSLEDWKLSLDLVAEMRTAGMDIDRVIYNTALATCVSADQLEQSEVLLKDMESIDGVADIITYNTLMKGYAKAGRMDMCDGLFEALKAKNISPSQVTYGILLNGFINANQPDKASQIFDSMREAGGTMNTVLYTTLIKGFARAGKLDQAMEVFGQMRFEKSMQPDLITFSILIKAHCDVDHLEDALKLLEAMIGLGLRPDEVVFNNLLAGCGRQSNVELGKRLYSDMIASGIKPSNATFSILIRLYHQCKLMDDAVELIRSEPPKHNVNPEPRIFQQLIQSCIRERQGRRAVEVYDMMYAHSVPTASAHSSMLSTCVKLNMYDTAAEILAIAAAKGGRVDIKDATWLLESTMRKRKSQVAHDIAASMAKLGFLVDSDLLPKDVKA
jgi:pentatricopeptide repeat protein